MITIKYTCDDDDDEFPWVVAAGGEIVAAYQTLEKAAEAATVIAWYLTTGAPTTKLGLIRGVRSRTALKKRES